MTYLPALASITASASPTPFHAEDPSSDWTSLMLTIGLVGGIAYALFNTPPRPARPGIGGMLAEGLVNRGEDYLARQGARFGTRLLGQGINAVTSWRATRQADQTIQEHLATSQTHVRAVNTALLAARTAEHAAQDSSTQPGEPSAGGITIFEGFATSTDAQATRAETASREARTIATTAQTLFDQHPNLTGYPAAANIRTINQNATAAETAATSARRIATNLTTGSILVKAHFAIKESVTATQEKLTLASKARDAAIDAKALAENAATNEEGTPAERIARIEIQVSSAEAQATAAETAAREARAIATQAQTTFTQHPALASNRTVTGNMTAIRSNATGAEASAQRARKAATEATTLSRQTAAAIDRAAAVEEDRARQKESLGYAIYAFIQDLSTISPNSYNRFIELSVRNYPLISKEEIVATVRQRLLANGEAICEYLDFLQNVDNMPAITAAIATNRAEIEKLLVQVRELRGSGFNGTINQSWLDYFAAAKKEIAAAVRICKSLLGQDPVLSEAESEEIFSIGAQSDNSTGSLTAIGIRYKNLLPAAIKHRNFSEIAARAENSLRQQYDIAAKASAEALKQYQTNNYQYEALCGDGFNPDTSFTVDGDVKVYTVGPESRIAYYQNAIAKPQQEIAAKVAFWTEILA